MPLVEDDDLVETRTLDTANDSFRVRVLPRAVKRNLDHTQMLDALSEGGAVDRVAVPSQVTWRGIPGKCFDDLLCGPLCCGVFGGVEVHDAPALVSQDDEDEEHLECGGWDGEEVTCHDVFDMGVQEGPPVW
jgi:hypothetical protein